MKPGDTRCAEVSTPEVETDFGNEKEFWVKEEIWKKIANFRWLFGHIDTSVAKASSLSVGAFYCYNYFYYFYYYYNYYYIDGNAPNSY